MKLQLVKATTDSSQIIFIQDSSSTTGAGLTGLAYDTASLVCYYVRPGSAAAALTLATQTVTGGHSDGGFVEVDATNMPGVYRLDLSDAILATGVDSVVIMLKGAADMAPLVLEIQLTDLDFNTSMTLNEIADNVLLRSASFVEDTAGDHTIAALILGTLESNAVGTAWTIRKTDGTTFLVKTLTVDPAAPPITGVT